MSFSVDTIRQQFPILEVKIHNKPLIYFDNAATTQKPKVVLDRLLEYYTQWNANIHRGIHYLAEKATEEYEISRKTAQKFINAEYSDEIVFSSGTTMGINLVAQTWVKSNLKKGDEILISYLEHHSNIVPWQMIAEEKELKIKVIPITEEGDLDLESFEKLLTEKTKFIAINHISNSLGTINPIEEIIKKGHLIGAKVLIDGAQAAAHLTIDVQILDCDFYVFSGHKIYGPTGIGVLYGKKNLLEEMPPFLGGGEMIKNVTFEKTTYNSLPYKFEAGTPDIANTIALKAAFDFCKSLPKNEAEIHENQLLEYAIQKIKEVKSVRIIGNPKKRSCILPFVMEGAHPQDIGILLDQQGVAVRTGHHCTQPLMDYLKIPGTIRASFAIYNTINEIDIFVKNLQKVEKMIR